MLYAVGGGAAVVKCFFSFLLLLFCLQKSTLTFASDVVSPPAISLEPYASYDAYSSVLPEPYLSYFRAYIDCMSPRDHYVIYVSQESKFVSGITRTTTVYNIAISSDLVYTGNSFEGSVVLYKIYSNSTYFSQFVTLVDNNFVLYPGTDLVYTDLSSPYPDLTLDKFDKSIFYLLVFFCLVKLIDIIFRRNL